MERKNICFHTAVLGAAKAHDFDHESKVSGVTIFSQDVPTHIKISICYKYFDKTSLFTLPFVIFHEAFCHAYQKSSAKPNERRERSPHCRFAEGWMDRVALEMLHRALTIHKAKAARSIVEISNQILTEARSFHNSRYEDDAPDEPHSRKLGVDAANAAALAIWYHPESFDALCTDEQWAQLAQEKFIKFSLLLNAIADDDQIEVIVSLTLALVSLEEANDKTLAFSHAVCHSLETLNLDILIKQLKDAERRLCSNVHTAAAK